MCALVPVHLILFLLPGICLCVFYIYIFHVDPCISWQHRVSADAESDHAHVVCEVDLLQARELVAQ